MSPIIIAFGSKSKTKLTPLDELLVKWKNHREGPLRRPSKYSGESPTNSKTWANVAPL